MPFNSNASAPWQAVGVSPYLSPPIYLQNLPFLGFFPFLLLLLQLPLERPSSPLHHPSSVDCQCGRPHRNEDHSTSIHKIL